jgi:hypothetical protein
LTRRIAESGRAEQRQMQVRKSLSLPDIPLQIAAITLAEGLKITQPLCANKSPSLRPKAALPSWPVLIRNLHERNGDWEKKWVGFQLAIE